MENERLKKLTKEKLDEIMHQLMDNLLNGFINDLYKYRDNIINMSDRQKERFNNILAAHKELTQKTINLEYINKICNSMENNEESTDYIDSLLDAFTEGLKAYIGNGNMKMDKIQKRTFSSILLEYDKVINESGTLVE